MGLTSSELSILLTDDREIRELNRLYRQVDAPTDVLAFPLEQSLEPAPGQPRVLGDVVISIETAQKQAEKNLGLDRIEIESESASIPSNTPATPAGPWSLEDEVLLLLVHGILHLVGHDHAEPDEARTMQSRQKELFLAVKKTT